MINATLKLFGKALVQQSNVTFKMINQVSVKMGYLVHPDLCNTDVLKWLDNQGFDYNSTFYKKWTDVIGKSRFELYLDQIKHYASTYGTGYTGDVYLPEGNVEVPPFEKFKVITPITEAELIERCQKMLFSGIALSQSTLDDVMLILNALNHNVDIDKVKNKEAKMFLYKKQNQLPTDAVEMVRYLVYLATSKTLLIKDADTLNAIHASAIDITKYASEFGVNKLAQVFYRFKPVFMAFKNDHNRKLINKLRKAAPKNHVPAKKTYFETILSNQAQFPFLTEKLKTLGSFKKVALLQTILVRLKQMNVRVFAIRNQKLYIKTENNLTANATYLKTVFDIIYADLVSCLQPGACSVKLPKSVNLTLPTSEKSFIGNYPLGTSFDFKDTDNIIGIYWRKEDGANDLDLKLIDIDGNQYGWNAAYKNNDNSIIFSGDMTTAYPEATELFYTQKGFTPAIVKVNNYNGEANSKFKFFIASEKLKSVDRNYMVNPNNIVVNVDCVMDSQEKQLGVITGDKFILAQFRTGRGRVAGNSVTNVYTDYALNTLDCYLSLQKLLTDAGYKIVTENEQADIDLTELSKDTLINLISTQPKEQLV